MVVLRKSNTCRHDATPRYGATGRYSDQATGNVHSAYKVSSQHTGTDFIDRLVGPPSPSKRPDPVPLPLPMTIALVGVKSEGAEVMEDGTNADVVAEFDAGPDMVEPVPEIEDIAVVERFDAELKLEVEFGNVSKYPEPEKVPQPSKLYGREALTEPEVIIGIPAI